jgi:hypothetical protein
MAVGGHGPLAGLGSIITAVQPQRSAWNHFTNALRRTFGFLVIHAVLLFVWVTHTMGICSWALKRGVGGNFQFRFPLGAVDDEVDV